jgi:hypothetical protein
MKIRYLWVIESRNKLDNGRWSRWLVGHAFTSRKEAVFQANPGEYETDQVRITKYISTR